jgi:hypothetical protein
LVIVYPSTELRMRKILIVRIRGDIQKMMQRCKQLGAVGLLLVLAACGGGGPSQPIAKVASVAEEAPVVSRAESATAPANSSSAPAAFKQRSARSTGLSRSIALPALPSKQLQALKQGRTPDVAAQSVPTQTGIGRAIDATSRESDFSNMLRWYPTGTGGLIAAVSITSPGALHLRLSLLVTALPEQAILRTYTQNGTGLHEVTGKEILATIQRNRDAGDLSEEGRTYWLPPTDGSEATLEIELPAGQSSKSVRLALPRLSHIFASLSEPTEKIKAIGDALICERDITCAGATYDAESSSTIQLNYVKSGNTFNCTGTLLVTTDKSFVPYVLTANHCFSNQTVSSTLYSTFFLRSAVCNSLTSRQTARLFGGATWLYSSNQTDTTFVRLNNPAPAGAVFAGWSQTTPTVGTQMLGVHHPMADLQMYSVGSLTAFRSCTLITTDGFYSCSQVPESGANYYAVNWTDGLTESGSSGSAAWGTLDGKRYVVGQLLGASTCSNAPGGSYTYSGTDTYGRFDIAYKAALNRWLSPAVTTTPRAAVYRFYNATTGAHFFTPNAAERDFVIASNRLFAYEGVAFYAYAAPLSSGTGPLYRFYGTKSGAHFYTIDEAEKASVLRNADYMYEGVAWNAQTNPGGTATPVYRFYNPDRGTHFYTINEQEKNLVQTNRAYLYEGVRYYAWTTQ